MEKRRNFTPEKKRKLLLRS